MIHNITSLLSLLDHILCPLLRCSQIIHGSIKQCAMMIIRKTLSTSTFNHVTFCEAQARVRQGSARDGPQGERPQSLNP